MTKTDVHSTVAELILSIRKESVDYRYVTFQLLHQIWDTSVSKESAVIAWVEPYHVYLQSCLYTALKGKDVLCRNNAPKPCKEGYTPVVAGICKAIDDSVLHRVRKLRFKLFQKIL